MPSWDISRPQARMLWERLPAGPVCFPGAADPRRPGTKASKGLAQAACARYARRFSRADKMTRKKQQRENPEKTPVVVQFQKKNVVSITDFHFAKGPTKT